MLRLLFRVLLFCVLKGDGGGIDAVAQAGWLGAVGENVAEVASAARAGDLNAAHAPAIIFVLGDGFGVFRNGEAGPSAAGVEFGVAAEEHRPATCAHVFAGGVILCQRSGKGALGAFLAEDVVLLGRKPLTPFRIAELELLCGICF